MILKHWFWPWQIFFNKEIKDDVVIFANKLTKKEQELYKFLLEFFDGFYTFKMLIDYLNEYPQFAKVAIEKAIKNINKLVNVPISAKDEYVKLINKQSKELRPQLRDILKHALNSKNRVDYEKYYSTLLGKKLYGDIYKVINNYKIKNVDFNQTREKNVYELHDFYSKHISNKSFQKKWEGALPNYSIKIKKGNGYGEYWDSYFFDEYSKNTLVLFKNERVYDDDVIYTLFHELYPGHGNFFEIIKKKKKNVDLGASLLIEGWATFCELSIGLNHNYEQYYKNKYYNFLQCSFNNKYCNLDSYEIYNMTNYPLFKENYYVGALLLKTKIQSVADKMAFYKKLVNNNITDHLLVK